MAKVTVKGLETVKINISKYFSGELSRIERAVIHWARMTHNDSVKMAPSDTGNLRRTGFFDHSMDGKGIYARVGFTAKYAPSVHEMISMRLKGKPREDFGKTREGVSFGAGSGKGFYWDNGKPKFLEIPARKNLTRLTRMIKGS